MHKTKPPVGEQPAEILHIDAIGSEEFFDFFQSNISEKCDCQRIVRDEFEQCVLYNGGWVAKNWQGDGGHAFFPLTAKTGASIEAARAFVERLPLIAQRTVTTLSRNITPSQARRKFRIKAHFANIFFAEDGGLDSGNAEEFDAFLKHERDIATIPDEIFVTGALWKRLPGSQKERFVRHKPEANYGKLRTSIYRLKSQPAKMQYLQIAADDVTDGELNFLKEQIRVQALITAARNFITTGLMTDVATSHDGALSAQKLLNLSMAGLYNYLQADSPHQSFRLSLWRADDEGPSQKLLKVKSYPPSYEFIPREVGARDYSYQVARAFKQCSPIVTEDVIDSRLQGDWKDFDNGQTETSRCLHSAMQLPVYRTTNPIGDFINNEVLGVLSLDCDKPRFFSIDLRDLWTNHLTGFLANIALAELMQRHSVPA